MHELLTVVWMEAPRDVPSKASRPVLSGRRRPLPASWFVRESIHSFVYALALRSSISCQLWSPTLALDLCRVVWIVLFARARVSSVLVYRFSCKLEALRSVHLVDLRGSFRFLVVLGRVSFDLYLGLFRKRVSGRVMHVSNLALERNDFQPNRAGSWMFHCNLKILRFQLSPVKPFCLKPSEAPRRKPLVECESLFISRPANVNPRTHRHEHTDRVRTHACTHTW